MQAMVVTKATMKMLEKAKWNDTIEYKKRRFAMYLLNALEDAMYESVPEKYRFTAAGFFHWYGDGDFNEIKELYMRLAGEQPKLVTAYTTHDLQYALIKDVNRLVRVLYGKIQ
jgi:hypothetical protein